MLTYKDTNDAFILAIRSRLVSFTARLIDIARVKMVCNKEWMKFIATTKFLTILSDYERYTLRGDKYNEMAYFINMHLSLNTLYNFIVTGGVGVYTGVETTATVTQQLLDEIQQLQDDLQMIGVQVKEFFFNDTNQITCIHNFGDIPLEIRLQDLSGTDYEFDVTYDNSNQVTLYWNTNFTGKVIIATVVTPN